MSKPEDMPMRKQVIIDFFPESAQNYKQGYAIVAVDIIRATTSAITIAAGGGRCFPVASIKGAFKLQSKLKNPLLAGEIRGQIAPGFEINNSPAELAMRDLKGQPVVLLSSSGTRLICEAMGCDFIHLACFRNYGYVARHLADQNSRVVVIGTGSRSEFREEDRMCCAWIARDLAEMGFAPANQTTFDLIKRWATELPEVAQNSRSAAYLRRSGQVRDPEFILAHINDLRSAFVMRGKEVVAMPDPESEPVLACRSFTNAVSEASTLC